MTDSLEQRLNNPPPGSAIEAARAFGIDLTLLGERLSLSPEERLQDLQRVMNALEEMRAARMRGASDDRPQSDITAFSR